MSKCEQCPDNTITTESGAVKCQCINGHYRATNEGPELACTSELKLQGSNRNVLVFMYIVQDMTVQVNNWLCNKLSKAMHANCFTEP